MSKSDAILYWDRHGQRELREQVFGDALVRWAYRTGGGQRVAELFMSGRLFSKLVGVFQSSAFSRFKIASFVRTYGIVMEEYEPGPFRSFNDFFTRRFRPGARFFCPAPTEMPAPAEGRYLAFRSVDPTTSFPVKGEHLTAAAILGDAERARCFEGGPAVIARLSPVDYHRFHFPDDGSVRERYRLRGRLHSVNPLALRYRGDIFVTNEREISILETVHFGRLAYVEVGAMCVGRIVQTHPEGRPFRRGDEKGMFLFGASTIVLFGEPGRWVPDYDLIEQTERERETFVRLGERIASVCS